MYRETKQGPRCRICTGCGLCPGVVRESAAGNHPKAVRESAVSGNPDGMWESAAGDYPKAVRESVVSDSPSGIRRSLHVLTEDTLGGSHIPLSCSGKRLAVADIGTTTIAMLLYHPDGTVADRFAEVNPQTVYGADVLSRIKAAQEPSAAAGMRDSVRKTLIKGLKRFRKQLSAGETLYLVAAANTTMTYLLMGWDTAELGRAPFRASWLSGGELELEGVPCFVLPGFSAFVGGDILAGGCACGIFHREEITLLVDLGTNGELLLGNCRRRIACATAAGPAFEGGVNRGIWGADMVRFLAALRKEGILDETGLLAEPYFEKGVRIGNVCVTKEAVRSIQLAKAAVAAGIEILLDKYGISCDAVDRVVLAGGFGYYLNPEDSAEIGLLPRALADKAVSGGNTALSGALYSGRELLLSDWGSVKEKLEKYRCGTEVVNLAGESKFNELYIQRMELK